MSIFGSLKEAAVTLNTDQDISGKKRFLSELNEFEGIMVQPLIEALSQTIDPTELSFLSGVSSNIQTQFEGINIVLTGLTALEQALQAIEPAPNATTVKFADTILLEDPLNSGNTLLLSPGEITNLVNINGLPYPQIWNQNTTGNALTATTAAATPYSGLTGSVPTWNQNTTGNAATSSSCSGNAATATSSTDSTKLPLTGGNINGNLTFSGGSREIVQTQAGQFLTVGTNSGCYPLILKAQGSTALYLNGNTILFYQPLVPNVGTSLPTSTTQIGGSATVTGQSLNRATSNNALSFANVTLTAGVWNLRGHLRVINAGAVVAFQPTQWGSWFNTSVAAPASAPYSTSTGADYFFLSTGQPSYSPLTSGVVGEKTGSTSFTLSIAFNTTIYQCCYLQFKGVGARVDAYMTLTYTRVA